MCVGAKTDSQLLCSFLLLEVMETGSLMFTICYRPKWSNQWRTPYPRNPLSHKCHRSWLRVRPLPSRTACLLQHNKVSTLAKVKLIEIRGNLTLILTKPKSVSPLLELWMSSRICVSFLAAFSLLNLFGFLNDKCCFHPLSKTLPFSARLFLRSPFKKPSLLWLVSSHRTKHTLQITKPPENVPSFEASLT